MMQDTAKPTTTTTQANPNEFRAVEGGTEQKDGPTLLVTAYALIWAIMMTWVFFVWRKQAKLHERLDGLEREIAKAAKK